MESQQSIMEQKAIACVEVQLGEPLRDDEPNKKRFDAPLVKSPVITLLADFRKNRGTALSSLLLFFICFYHEISKKKGFSFSTPTS